MPRHECKIENGSPIAYYRGERVHLRVGARKYKGNYGVMQKHSSRSMTAVCKSMPKDFWTEVQKIGDRARIDKRILGVCQYLKGLGQNQLPQIPTAKVCKSKSNPTQIPTAEGFTFTINEPWTMDHGPWTMGKELSRGLEGSVHAVNRSQPSTEVGKGEVGWVAKQWHHAEKNSEKNLREILLHVVLACLCGTASVVPRIRFAAQFKQGGGYILVMGKMSITLFDYMVQQATTNCALCVPRVLVLLRTICNQLMIMQSRVRFMHRDLHARNVMLEINPNRPNDVPTVKFVDFGASRLTFPVCECVKVPKQATICRTCMGYSTPWDLVNVTSHYPEDHYNKGLDMATLLLSMHHAILTQSDLGCIAKVWTTKVANPVVYPLLKKLKKNDAAMAYALDKPKVNFTERRHTRDGEGPWYVT